MIKRWVIVGSHGNIMFPISFPECKTPIEAWIAFLPEFSHRPEDFAKALLQDLARGYRAVEKTYKEVEK